VANGDSDRFQVRTGRTRRSRAPVNPRTLPFVRQVEIAIRKQGGNPYRIGASAGKGSGRFNARGRGGKVAAGLPKVGSGWRQDGNGIRFRSRRVVVKARVVKLPGRTKASGRGQKFVTTSKAVDAHLRYLQRDGVTRDGEKGRVYSAFDDEADGKAFVERGRGDRHQFRFIVAPEDAAEMEDLRSFTRDLMRQMEADLDTRLDWIAVDHHNTGHPHTHVLVRGITDDGKILNIAGDYIAHGIRHRASELVERELGLQSEIEVARKLANEVHAERLTRLDRMLIAEQREHDLVDLRPDASDSYTVRSNRYLLIDRAKKLQRFDLASEIEPGRWIISDRAESTLRALGEHNDIIKAMHRALDEYGLADERGPAQYVMHRRTITEPVVGRVLAKGLADDEMSDRLSLVIDGVDGRTHYVETADAAKLEDIQRGHIVALDPILPKEEPRAADHNISVVAGEDGIYRPSGHLETIRETFLEQGKDPDAFVRFHVRRLEALRRAGHVERIDEDHWRVPEDLPDRGIAYDARNRGKDFSVRVISTLDLDAQIGSDGATWLDRELTAKNPMPLVRSGFGLDVDNALDKRAAQLVRMGHAERDPTSRAITFSRDLVATLEGQEVARVGKEMAAARDLTFEPAQPGNYVGGTLLGSVSLASGRFAMIDNGLGFQLVPWQPMLDKRIGQHITGIVQYRGGIEWSFSRKRGLGMGM
jgi:type IV secretory pathway VirD2 relaxase